MIYITSLGMQEELTRETVSVYRAIAGVQTEVASGILTSHIYPVPFTVDIDTDYQNFSNFKLKYFTTTYSGILQNDRIHLNSGVYAVRVVNHWQTPDYYHCIVEDKEL